MALGIIRVAGGGFLPTNINSKASPSTELAHGVQHALHACSSAAHEAAVISEQLARDRGRVTIRCPFDGVSILVMVLGKLADKWF
jgi:hypothetical protein